MFEISKGRLTRGDSGEAGGGGGSVATLWIGNTRGSKVRRNSKAADK